MGESGTTFYWGGTADQQLEIAIFLAKWANPDLTSNASVGWSSQPGGAVTLGGSIPTFGPVTNMLDLVTSNVTKIYIDPSLLDQGVCVLAMIIAHELHHAQQNRQSDSILEEVLAYGIQYQTGKDLHVDEGNGNMAYARQFFDYGPNPTDEQLLKAKEKLKGKDATGRMYGNLPLRPPSNRFSETITLIRMVKGLIVGSIWN